MPDNYGGRRDAWHSAHAPISYNGAPGQPPVHPGLAHTHYGNMSRHVSPNSGRVHVHHTNVAVMQAPAQSRNTTMPHGNGLGHYPFRTLPNNVNGREAHFNSGYPARPSHHGNLQYSMYPSRRPHHHSSIEGTAYHVNRSQHNNASSQAEGPFYPGTRPYNNVTPGGSMYPRTNPHHSTLRDAVYPGVRTHNNSTQDWSTNTGYSSISSNNEDVNIEEPDEGPFHRCKLCSKCFVTVSDIVVHAKYHHDNVVDHIKQIKCKVCGLCLTRKEKYAMHLKRHESLSPGQCTFCLKIFRGPGQLKEHFKIHKNTDNLKCSNCDRVFRSVGRYEMHIISQMCSRNICDHCGKSFPSSDRLRAHLVSHATKRPHICRKCNRSYKSKSNLQQHMKTHEKNRVRKYLCDICGKTFKSSHEISQHKKCHSELRPYKCTICGKGYKFPQQLRRHVQLHTTNQCQNDRKTKHSEHKQVNTGSRSSSSKTFNPLCHFCNKSFKYLSVVKSHMLTHRHKNPHNCRVCGKGFISSRTLAIHKARRHSQKRLHKCEICGKSFMLAAMLQIHQRAHKEVRPYKCCTCGRCFGLIGAMKTHACIHVMAKIKSRPAFSVHVKRLYQFFSS